MKTFKVQRSFDEEVLITKSVLKSVDVDIKDITHQDLMSMEYNTLRSYASAARLLLIERSSTVIDPQPIVDISPLTEPTQSASTSQSIGKSGLTIGSKIGKTSKYHYVYFDSNQNKFNA